MESGLSIWEMVYRYGYQPYRYDHPGYRYGIWANDMGDVSIDTVISHIDMGYGLMIWEMSVSIRSSPVSIWDILSLCLEHALQREVRGVRMSGSDASSTPNR